MSTNRVSWIDLAKSMSLIGVIIVHSLEINQFSAVLTGFVLPAFFILYGVAHNNEKHRYSIQKLIRSRFTSLMIPYFILSIAMVAIYAALYSVVDVGLSPTEFAFWTVYGNGPIQRVSHLWYLRALFFAIVLFTVFDRYLHDKPAVLRLMIAIFLPGIAVAIRSAAGLELLPWGVDSALIALSFVIVGNEIRQYHNVNSWSINPVFDVVALTLSVTIFLLLAMFNGYVNIGMSLYGFSIYIYMVTGILGTYIVSLFSFHACNSFDISKAIARFNRYGQEIYELHPLMIELNVQLVGSLTLWNMFIIFPDTPLFLINLLTGIFVSWLIASQLITRSSILQIMFTGRVKPRLSTSASSPEVREVQVDSTFFAFGASAPSSDL